MRPPPKRRRGVLAGTPSETIDQISSIEDRPSPRPPQEPGAPAAVVILRPRGQPNLGLDELLTSYNTIVVIAIAAGQLHRLATDRTIRPALDADAYILILLESAQDAAQLQDHLAAVQGRLQ